MVVYRLVVEAKAAAPLEGTLAGWQEAARMKGWRLLPAPPNGEGSGAAAATFEGSEGVPQAMEFLFDSLQAAKERGEVQEGYDIKLLVDEGAAAAVAAPAAAAGPTGPAPAAPAATPTVKSKKSRWAGLF
jgi:hypothetical protein